jgi:hypothetical protein
MWISKKKLKKLTAEVQGKAFIEGMDTQDEAQQWHRIEKLEKQVKKLKKAIKEGY